MNRPKVPNKCLICGAEWRGGQEVPGKDMKFKLRVFYDCGASLSCENLGCDAFRLLIKNCGGRKEDEPI